MDVFKQVSSCTADMNWERITLLVKAINAKGVEVRFTHSATEDVGAERSTDTWCGLCLGETVFYVNPFAIASDYRHHFHRSGMHPSVLEFPAERISLFRSEGEAVTSGIVNTLFHEYLHTVQHQRLNVTEDIIPVLEEAAFAFGDYRAKAYLSQPFSFDELINLLEVDDDLLGYPKSSALVERELALMLAQYGGGEQSAKDC